MEETPDVLDCHGVRVRSSGSQCFLDLHVNINGDITSQKAHDLTEEIERTIRKIVPGCDIAVHPETD